MPLAIVTPGVRMPFPRRALVVLTTLGVAWLGVVSPAAATTVPTVTTPTLQQASKGGIANKSGTGIQNVTQLETDSFAWGSTVVSAFQVGRSNKGFGAAGIGFSTSTNNGATWRKGVLPGLTSSSPTPNPAYPLVVNQSVAYDSRHGRWLVPSVTYVPTGDPPPAKPFREKALLLNSSADGKVWTPATTVVDTNVDKAWGVCDNTTTSPFYGTCYIAYSQLDSGDALAVVTSTDGGVTWTPPVNVPDGRGGNATGYNVMPVVQPNGTVVVVGTELNGQDGSALTAFTSTDGGTSWTAPTAIATISVRTITGLRAMTKPTVDVDATGQVTVAWADCRFQAGCTANGIVTASSTDGISWGEPVQVLLPDPTSDVVNPSFAIAPGTSGSTAQLSVAYYALVPCATTCLDARYATSYDGGQTWSNPYTLNTTPMPTTWFAYSPRGRMVGDYTSVCFVHGSAISVLPLVTAAPSPYTQTIWALSLPPGFVPA